MKILPLQPLKVVLILKQCFEPQSYLKWITLNSVFLSIKVAMSVYGSVCVCHRPYEYLNLPGP